MFPSLGDQRNPTPNSLMTRNILKVTTADEAPLIQTWQKIKAVKVRAQGTSSFHVTSAALAQDVAMC